MIRSKSILVIAAVLLAASCATAPPPATTPAGEDRYLPDPRTGYTGIATPAVAKQFDAAWRFALSGNELEAGRRLTGVLRADPDYLPATLTRAFLDLRAGRLAEATKIVDAVLVKNADYTAALTYQAEIAVRENRTRTAWDLYRAIAARNDAPATAAERVAMLQNTLYTDSFTAAKAASGEESVRLLRESLTFQPSAFEPRILLAQHLLAQRRFDDARKELDPLLDTSADRTEVQELLAEIDVGRSRYEEAILRLDRLARKTKDERYARRLEEIKQEWSAANMPSYHREALESPSVTRAQFSVLLYWTVPSIRFARNLGTPGIATDLTGLEGREEMIRALAIGLFDIDPITRTVNPGRTITAERLARLLARVLTVRGATCAKGQPGDRVLSACGVSDPLAAHPPDDTLTGRETLALLQQVARHL